MSKLFNREMMETSRFLFSMGAAVLFVVAHADETHFAKARILP